MRAKNKILITLILITLTTSLCAAGDTYNADLNDGSLLLFKVGYVDTDITEETGLRSDEEEPTVFNIQSLNDEEKYYIVQFTGPIQNTWKQEIISQGASIYNYVPNNAFVFRMNETVKSQVYSLDSVKWIGEYKPSYKYMPDLTDQENIQVSASGKESKNTYHVLLFSSADRESVIDAITALDGDVTSGSGNILKVQIPASRLPYVATIDDVSWIEEYLQPEILNDVAADIITVETVHNNYGLKGSGQIVAVCDTGLDTGNKDTLHLDMRGRVLNIIDTRRDGSAADQNGHGTHVAGSVLGNGERSGGQYSGMAPEAELVFQAVGDDSNSLTLPDNLGELFQTAYSLNATIHTNSWGSNANGAYTLYSQQVDQFMWENPDMLIIFAAGNSGEYGSGTINAPGTAKNALTVGASENYRPSYTISDNINEIAYFSSRGPTDDGRIKPDLVAPGTYIYSTKSSLTSGSGYYTYMSGTSMATPIVAGTAALVRQYYVDIEGLTNPSAALIKATLINGAYDMTSGQDWPNYSQGWGRVDLNNSIYPEFPKVIGYFDNPKPLSTIESWNESFKILQKSESLRVTLVWTDYPGEVAYAKELVNDLDLIIIGPDATPYYGNGAPDRNNTVESIELLNPDVGDYQLIVKGENVIHGPQNFSVVVSYESADVFPLKDTYTTDITTAVHINLTSPSGINSSSIKMTVDNSQVNHSITNIEDGYTIRNQTLRPYTEGYHSASISARTNTNNSFDYSWRFYISAEENVITINGLEENAVMQNETLEINISNRKLCDFWYNVDKGANLTEENTFSFNTTFNLTEGYHNITVFAEDITGNITSTTVNFAVFTSQPVITSPASGTIYYLPDNGFNISGNAGIATNVSVYVNGEITNSYDPVSNGTFNINNIPLLNGTNTVDITSILNYFGQKYFSNNITIYLSVGGISHTDGNDEAMLPVPGIGTVPCPILNFNITGASANPGSLAAAVVRGQDPCSGSTFAGPAIDIRAMSGSEPVNSYQFGRNVSMSLGYNPVLVDDVGKLTTAWYDPDEETWVPFRSVVNSSAHTITTNITHLSIYAPLEDKTAPVISGLNGSGKTFTVTLTWQSSTDTDHVEIRKNNHFLTNTSDSPMTDSGLSPGTTYTYSLRAIDFVGNIGEWFNISVTTSQLSEKGNSGAGGGSSGESAENILFKDVLAVNTMADTAISFDFDNAMNDIQYVRYLSLKNSGKISTTIEVLKNTSGFVKSAAPDITYRNINIWVGKTGYATEGNIQNPVIGFRVSQKWVLDNAIDPYTIKLNRYSGGAWEELATEQTGSDNNYLYFEAKTPGFSPFAITGKQFSLAKQGREPDILLQEIEVNTVSLTPDGKRDSKGIGKYALSGAVLGLSGVTLTAAYLFRRGQQN